MTGSDSSWRASGPVRCWPVASAAVMRVLDRHTIEDRGVAGEVLMESAGRAVTELLLRLGYGRGGDEIVVVCGTGNNGGDGLVIARHLHQEGLAVRAALVGDPGSLQGDAALNWKRAGAAGVPLEGPDWQAPRRGVLVDAIFGTGLGRAVEGGPAAAIERIRAAREHGVTVVSVDLPSGIHADTGQVLGVAVAADHCVTISLPKPGLLLEPGRAHAGRVHVARVGIVDRTPDLEPALEVWTRAGIATRLPGRPPAGHKGSFGHVLVVGAGLGRTGAAALAAAGAGRIGAGLVTIACPASLNDILEVKCTEAMTAPVAETAGRNLAAGAEEAVVELAAERDVVVCGPGVGREPETAALVRRLAGRLACPWVLDADGLFSFAGEPGTLRKREAVSVLTPHPGEAARLLGRSAGEINRDRIGAARELCERTGAVSVLKGAATVIAAPARGDAPGRIAINATGGPLLASGGTGDVLSGLIGGLLAQGLPAFEAAVVGCFVHGAAADRLAGARGDVGVLAGDLAAALPETVASLRLAAAESAAEGLLLPFPWA